MFTGSQFSYPSLPGSGKVLSLVVLGFIAGSHWAIGLRLGAGGGGLYVSKLYGMLPIETVLGVPGSIGST